MRYALACEFSRLPIRRTEVVKKVMDEEGRDFRTVFAEAQMMLQATFGMVMKEQPGKDKVSVRDRRGLCHFALFYGELVEDSLY